MHYIGFWARTIYDDPLVFPQELPICSDVALREKMIRYLNAGIVHEVYRGWSYCRYHCGISDEEMGDCELTDGTWVWPIGLAHYVDTHHISLPPEFVNSVLELPLDPSLSQYTTPDAYWIVWSQQQRTQSKKHLVSQLREQCDRECSLALEQEYESQTRETGMSSKKCIWKSCTSAALKDRVFCARHLDARANQGELKVYAWERRFHYTSVFLQALKSQS